MTEWLRRVTLTHLESGKQRPFYQCDTVEQLVVALQHLKLTPQTRWCFVVPAKEWIKVMTQHPHSGFVHAAMQRRGLDIFGEALLRPGEHPEPGAFFAVCFALTESK